MSFIPIATAVRYLLLFVAGHLATKGYLDASLVDTAASAGVALSAVVWYAVTKKSPKRSDYDPDYSSDK